MRDQKAFIQREDIKNPAVLLFIAVYIFALAIVLAKDRPHALAYIGMSMGMLFLIWL